MSDEIKLKPLSGHCFVELENNYQNTSLEIPEILKRRITKVGIVKSVSLWEKGRLYQIWQRGRKETCEAARYNHDFTDLEGKRVFVETGRCFDIGKKRLMDVRLEHVVCIIPDKIKADSNVHYGNVPRCHRCKSDTGEMNMLLDNYGYCIKCGKNENGDNRPPVNDFGIAQHKPTEKQINDLKEIFHAEASRR